MPTVGFSPHALEDLERLTDFLLENDPAAAAGTAALITEAVKILRVHPLLGRPATASLRELVISRGRSGYLALYTFDEERDHVWVTAIRHQREAGFDE
jgi:addiction module RelE/StbE family toxin